MVLKEHSASQFGFEPTAHGLNRKCIKALYLETHMPFLGNSLSCLSDFIGSPMQVGVSILSLVFIIYEDLMLYSKPGESWAAYGGRLMVRTVFA